MSQQIGSFGFKLEIPVSGLSTIPPLTLKVAFQRPDNTEFERLSTDGDVEINDSLTLVNVRIKAGDFTVRGIYHYQIFDLTAGANNKSTIGAFFTEANFVPQPV